MAARRTGRDRWSSAGIGDQTGRTVVITGGNGGIGWETAKALAARGASLVLAGRDAGRMEAAAGRLRAGYPDGLVQAAELDLASLASVRGAAAEIRGKLERLDVLVNNAGVMMPPRGATADGFELQFGVNHLGHFALTGLLMPLLLATPGSRVVTVSSIAHRGGRMNFDDLQSARRYNKSLAYGQSKLANLLFTYELGRRLTAAGAGTIALAAHPGVASTDLARHMSPLAQMALSQRMHPLNAWLVHTPAAGSLPLLRAATDPGAVSGMYFGPGGFLQMTGRPVVVTSTARSHNARDQRRLWAESERLTGVTYPV